MKNFFIGHISAFFFLSILTTAYPLQATEDALPLRARYFKIQIKFPGEAALTGKHYMDIKRGVVGFGRDGETFEAVSCLISCITNESRSSIDHDRKKSISTALSKATLTSLHVHMAMGFCWKTRCQDTTFGLTSVSHRSVSNSIPYVLRGRT